MSNSSNNLKKILEYLDISNVYLAKNINVDASLISRWLSGQRQLRLSSDIMKKLSKYLLDKIVRSGNTDWLIHQMELDGLSFDFDSPDEIIKCLKFWLSSDGKDVRKALVPITEKVKSEYENSLNSDVKTGSTEIAIFIESVLEKLSESSQIGIHLSNEDTSILLYENISRALISSMNNNIQIKLLISVSSNTMAVSRLLSRYIQAIIEGSLSVSVVHGMTQAITNQATFIFSEENVLIVCETPKSTASPIGTTVYEKGFIRECRKSFEHAFNYSQSLLQRYNDNYSRNILEILYQEFAVPGNLDVIKDSINPMYMSIDVYNQFLKTLGFKGEQFKWRSAEFVRFKTGMDENLNSGTVFREVLSLNRLQQIAIEGKCKMPALYFMNTGIVYLNAAGCLSIIEGYIDYLKKIPNFNLLILDDLTELNVDNCWQLKQNSHVAINGWSREEHIILYSNQLMMTHEFQIFFDNLWNNEHYSEGRRKKTILVLRNIAEQLRSEHGLP